MDRELDVEGVRRRVGIDERVTALMQLAAVGDQVIEADHLGRERRRRHREAEHRVAEELAAALTEAFGQAAAQAPKIVTQ